MNRKHLNGKVMALGLSGVLAVSIVGVGFAQAPSPGSSAGPAEGQSVERHRPHRGPRAVIRRVAAASGLPGSVFKEGFEAGKSINQILTENGKDPAAVRATLLDNIDARLDKAVAEQKLTQARADEIYANSQQALERLFGRQPDPDRDPRPRPIVRLIHALEGMTQAAAEAIGITPRELAAELRHGNTPAEVAAAHNVSAQAVIDAIVADGNARIDRLVTEGKVDAARAAEMKAKLAEHAEKFVNEGPPRRPGAQPGP